MGIKNLLIRRYLFIGILPLTVLIASSLLRGASGPFWLYADPCYINLFNALYMVKGHPPVDVTHPGTPVQILIFIVIWTINLGQSVAHAVNDILIRPEFYLNTAWIILAASAFLTSILLGAYVYRKTNDRIAVALVQLPGLVFLVLPSFNANYPMLPIVANVDCESLFIPVLNLFSLSILRLYFAQNPGKDLKNVFLLAFICGLGLAIKLNFFPAFLAALILVPVTRKILFILACALSFVFWTLPIIKEYSMIWDLIKGIILHTSINGRGPETIIDWRSYFQYFKYMVLDYWFYIFLSFCLFLWSMICLIKNRGLREVDFIGAMALGVLLQFAATAKYFDYHYLVPGLGLFGLIFVLFYFYLTLKFPYQHLKILAVIFLFLFFSKYMFQTAAYQHRLTDWTQDIISMKNKVHHNYPSCTVLPTWAADVHMYLSQEHALYIANGTILYTETEDLSRIYPDFYYFYSEEIGPSDAHQSYGIWNFKKRILGDDLLNTCPCSIFLRYNDDFSRDPYQVRLLDSSKYLSVYLLTGSTEKEANSLFLAAQDSVSKGDYAQGFALALRSRQLNYQPRGQVEYFLAVIYHYLKGNNP